MAAKLDQVPVPDLSDSIWAGIESQLDAGASVDTPKGKGWWYGMIGIVTVATLILIWWHYGHKSNAPERAAPMEVVPIIKEPLPARDSSAIIDKPEKEQLPVAPVPVKKDPILHKSVDSAFRQVPPPARQDLSPVKVDSLSGQPNKAQPQHIDPVNIPLVVPAGTAGKKHRGVKGITEDDYKISAKKDSAGRSAKKDSAGRKD